MIYNKLSIQGPMFFLPLYLIANSKRLFRPVFKLQPPVRQSTRPLVDDRDALHLVYRLASNRITRFVIMLSGDVEIVLKYGHKSNWTTTTMSLCSVLWCVACPSQLITILPLCLTTSIPPLTLLAGEFTEQVVMTTIYPWACHLARGRTAAIATCLGHMTL